MLFRSITVQFKRKGQTDEIQGISFSKGGYTFKGSEIDRSFSFSKLDKCFGDAGRMDLSEDMLRTMVLLDRLAKARKER